MRTSIWLSVILFSPALASPLPNDDKNVQGLVPHKENSAPPPAPPRIDSTADSITSSDRTDSDLEFSILNTDEWGKIETWEKKGSLAIEKKNKHTLTEAVHEMVVVLGAIGAVVNQKKAKELAKQSTLSWEEMILIWKEVSEEVEKGLEAAKGQKRPEAEAAAEMLQTRLVLMKKPLLGL